MRESGVDGGNAGSGCAGCGEQVERARFASPARKRARKGRQRRKRAGEPRVHPLPYRSFGILEAPSLWVVPWLICWQEA